MLRAVGMTRRQVRRMIRHESIVTALLGAALGIPLGVFLSLLVGRRSNQVLGLRGAGRLAGRVLRRGDRGRDAGGDLAGPAGGAAQCAGGLAVRVSGIRGGEFQWEFRGPRGFRPAVLGAKLPGSGGGGRVGETPGRCRARGWSDFRPLRCPNPRSAGGVVHLDRSERPECPCRPAGRGFGHWSRLATRAGPSAGGAGRGGSSAARRFVTQGDSSAELPSQFAPANWPRPSPPRTARAARAS